MNKQMLTIEIQKAGFINKGAELMLLSAVDKLRERYPNIRLTMETTNKHGEQPYARVLELNIFPKAHLTIKKKDLSSLFNYVPSRILERYGLVKDNEVDILLDAAGFAYSSQWGDIHVTHLLNKIQKLKRNNAKIILMPQAFGPFRSQRIKKDMYKVLSLVDAAFVRDSISYDNLVKLNRGKKEFDNIFIFPDFTNLVTPIVPNYINGDDKTVCVVPNKRMIDMNTTNTGEYNALINRIIGKCIALGVKPFILVHEKNDRDLADNLTRGYSNVPIIVEDNPLVIKGIISKSAALIGSRYHSLVSGLSQGIPSIGTGWSHKYNELFRDYAFSEGLINLDISDRDLDELLYKILDPTYSKVISTTLNKEAKKQRILSEEMWEKVFSIIEN